LIEHENDPVLLPQVDHAAHQSRGFVGQAWRFLHRVGEAAEHFRYAIYNEGGAMTLGSHHDQPPVARILEPRHPEPPPLIDHRHDVAAQIDQPFEKSRRLGDAGDLVGNAGDFVDRIDGKPEFIVSKPKHQEFGFHAPDLPGTGDCRHRRLMHGAESLHDVLPEKLLGREDRDEPPSSLAPVDRLDPRLAAGPRRQHRGNGIDQAALG
jgi:hypothetical protein